MILEQRAVSLLKDFSDFDLDSCKNAIGGPCGKKEHIRNMLGLARLETLDCSTS